MKAVVYEKYGTPDVLQLKEIDKPTPKDNEVLIKVHAAEATKSDCEMRSFKFAVKWFWLPLRIALGLTKPRRQVLGGYFAEEVESLGKNVSKFNKGDQVFGCAGLRMGCYSEYITLPDSYTIVPKPSNINFEAAAAIPLGGLNALHFLKKSNIQNGEKILINGAGGSIGTFGVMIAKEEFTKGDKTYDVIFDMVAGSSYSECVKKLKPKGRYLMANPRLSDMLRSVLSSKFTDKTMTFAFAGEKEEELLALKEMIEEGKIEAIVDEIYPVEQAAESHRRVEREQRLGPVVLSLGNFKT